MVSPLLAGFLLLRGQMVADRPETVCCCAGLTCRTTDVRNQRSLALAQCRWPSCYLSILQARRLGRLWAPMDFVPENQWNRVKTSDNDIFWHIGINCMKLYPSWLWPSSSRPFNHLIPVKISYKRRLPPVGRMSFIARFTIAFRAGIDIAIVFNRQCAVSRFQSSGNWVSAEKGVAPTFSFWPWRIRWEKQYRCYDAPRSL